jgi:hypothetical protein
MMKWSRCLFLPIVLIAVTESSAAPIPQPQRIEVYPAQIILDTQRSSRQLIVTGFFNDEPRDLTAQAQLLSSDPKILAIKGTRAVPIGDGSASISVTVAGQTARVPAVVSNSAKPDPVQFKFETVAVLTKQGCATGSCHGSPHGKGNFSLSLFGYDPSIDRVSLTRDGFSRRVNVMEPSESLMLKKPLMEISHVGGKRLMKSDTAYRILYDWIYEGAATPLPAVECQKIVIHPASHRILKAPFLKQQISVLARYSDGTVRDVTAIATYTTSNAAVAEANADGLVTGKSRGQAAISVRYLDKLESIFFTVIEDIPGFAWNNPAENNFIDRLVDDKLRQLQFLPSDTCNDSTFVRRIYLDLTGLLPTADAARQFIADKSSDKCAKLIDRLLETEDFARFWAQKKAELMRVSPQVLKEGRADLFAEWIIDAQRKNLPYDQFARQILTASGSTLHVPPANYYEAVGTMEERTEMTAEIFMGSRLECTKCHNHPFENWTMKDYYSLAAVFVRTKDENGEVSVSNSGEAMHPTSHQAMVPWGTPATPHATVAASDRRQVFADWLVAKGNPFFARVEVNRIWAQLLGRGIVEPVDDFRSSNPPVNGPLLNALAAEFEKAGYDRKHVIRLICNSRTYRRSTEAGKFNEDDDTLFSHATARLLSAEQLKDAIGMVSGSLTPTPVVEKKLADARRDFQARETELERGYDAWLSAARRSAKAASNWAGIWYSVGPFEYSRNPGKEQFPPEKHPVNLSEKFDKGLLWRQRLDLGDANSRQSLDGSNKADKTVTFLYRRIECDDDQTQTVQLQASNGALVWLNEQSITPALLKGNSTLRLNLKAGENHLLIKVVTRAKTEFSYLPKIEKGTSKKRNTDLPGFLIELLALPAESLADFQRHAARDYYFSADGSYRGLRDQIRKLQSRAEYATQCAVPDRSAFLATFGQPQRQSACTCERSHTPTLLQAFELLNGNIVSGMLGAAQGTYGKLDDDKLIDEIYLASYSRLPTEKDRAKAREYLKNAEARPTAISDLAWAIVNTREFLFQH